MDADVVLKQAQGELYVFYNGVAWPTISLEEAGTEGHAIAFQDGSS